VYLEQNNEIISKAERIAANNSAEDVLSELRKLCLWDFGNVLLNMPDPRWPNLSRVLPRMASKEVQQSWTGHFGTELLTTSCDFVRMMVHNFSYINKRQLTRAKMLDFGCGYGRIMRLMYYFTSPNNVYGIDPWQRSLDICQEDNVLGHLRKSEFVPDSLPLPNEYFDVIYAYSVFTHTSLAVTKSALRALREHISPSGMLIITTRPIDYWHVASLAEQDKFDKNVQISQHIESGFSFFPSNWNCGPDEESIFGDTSIDPNWLSQNVGEWEVRSYDRGIDLFQTVICLTPR
jgi:SAM-dependent methyltransferase